MPGVNLETENPLARRVPQNDSSLASVGEMETVKPRDHYFFLYLRALGFHL